MSGARPAEDDVEFEGYAHATHHADRLHRVAGRRWARVLNTRAACFESPLLAAGITHRIRQFARNLSRPSWAMLQPSAKFSILEDQAEFQPLGLLTQLPKGYSRIRIFRC